MSRTVLKYVYLALGTALAMLAERPTPQERRRLERSGEARSPMEAATYRANEWVGRPLRTVWVIVGYQFLFTDVAVCATHPDQIIATLGREVGGPADLIAANIRPVVPAALLPVLPVIGVALGLMFTVVVHQSLLTAEEIRRAYVA
jgi:hypothetical protein